MAPVVPGDVQALEVLSVAVSLNMEPMVPVDMAILDNEATAPKLGKGTHTMDMEATVARDQDNLDMEAKWARAPDTLHMDLMGLMDTRTGLVMIAAARVRDGKLGVLGADHALDVDPSWPDRPHKLIAEPEGGGLWQAQYVEPVAQGGAQVLVVGLIEPGFP